MGIAHSIEELKKLSDAELIRKHDKEARNTVVGTQYYVDEIRYRQHARLTYVRDAPANCCHLRAHRHRHSGHALQRLLEIGIAYSCCARVARRNA